MDSPRRSSHRGNDEDCGVVGPYPSMSTRSSYWDMDSNFGCGDTVSVSETLDCINDSDVIYPSQTVANIERCMSCFSKLGAPSMSRSSTGIGTQLGYGQQQVWAINSGSSVVGGTECGHKSNQNNAVAVDRMSLCSSQASSSSNSNNSEYSIAKLNSVASDLWNANRDSGIKTCTCPNGGSLTLRKNGLVCTVCEGSAPAKARPGQKAPMPAPITTQLQPTQNNIGAYENYDFPKVHPLAMENYDTPRSIREQLPQVLNTADYGNYDMPAAIVGQMCSCLRAGPAASEGETKSPLSSGMGGRRDCACNRVMSWADNLICRRGNGVENTGIAVNKLKLTGEGKMPFTQLESLQPSELYATVDVTKKIKTRLVDMSTVKKCQCPPSDRGKSGRPDSQLSNYINIDPSQSGSSNYANLQYEAKETEGTNRLAPSESQNLVDEGDLSICRSCGHPSVSPADKPKGAETFNHNYLLMQPKSGSSSSSHPPGYLPMSPANLAGSVSGQPPHKTVVNRAVHPAASSDKSASNPSLHVATNGDPADHLPGGCHSASLKDAKCGQVATSASHLNVRTRSASADSSRFLEDDSEHFESSETLCRVSRGNIHEQLEHQQEERQSVSTQSSTQNPQQIGASTETEDEVSVSLTQSVPTNCVNIRRSESVPVKTHNRDSSSSNDSGVSTSSLKQRAKDFESLELSSSSASAAALRKHRHSLPCTRVTLPRRRSKSSDPLKELSFRFRKTRIPEKSTSAEAEIPICPPKADTYGSPTDGQSMASTVPYIDSRSTSSGTSDMSDYIETLSLCSHSSSDVPEAARWVSFFSSTPGLSVIND